MQERVQVYTLVDISESSALQMQNYNALIQTIQLRSNVENVGSTLNGNQDLTRYNFGTNFGNLDLFLHVLRFLRFFNF